MHRTTCLLIGSLALAGCSFNPPSTQTELQRKRITLQPPAMADNLERFPVAVLLEGDGDLMTSAQSSGKDIFFTGDDGETLLPFEIEAFDASAGELVAWVQVPRLAATGTTDLFMYYGGLAGDAERDSTVAWSSFFRGVWHLAPSDSDSSVFADSTASGNHGTAVPLAMPAGNPGIAGPGLVFDGDFLAGGDLVAIGDPADESLDPGTGSFSVSAWVKVEDTAGVHDTPWSKGGYILEDPGYSFELGDGIWLAAVADGATRIEAFFGLREDFNDEWTCLVAVIDRPANELRAYVNGAPAQTLTNVVDISGLGSLSSQHEAFIGADTYDFTPFRGEIDEVRVYAGTLSESWIAAEHANLAEPESFLTVHPAKPAPDPR